MKASAIVLAAITGASAAVTTTLPKSATVTNLPTAIPVPKGAKYDGGMKRFEREPLATTRTRLGVHCRGTCTLNNVWWVDVCEDAATFKHTSGTSTVNGGGAFKAEDKIFQFNGRGTLNINDFYANDYGKLARNCGNCEGNGGPRNINIKGVVAKNGGELCGVNSNYGDVCTISNSCQDKGKSCQAYIGNANKKEPPKDGNAGHNGKSCIVNSSFNSNC
ncbi:hypothetical protein ACJ41O_006842 [Fusarium nematophilum]